VGSPAEPPLAILAARTGTGPAESPTSPAAGRPADESENTDPMTQVWHGRTPATYLYSADRREQLLAAPALVAEGRPTGLGVLIGAAAQTSPASASRRHHALPRPNASPRPAIRLDEAEASRYTPVVRRGPRWGLIAAISLVCCALLVGLWAAFNYARSQYFVAAANGQVAIYQGFPGDIAGLATNRAVEWTEIAMTDLPLTWRQRVEEGIPAGDGGLYQAHLTVDELAKTSVECLARRAERTGSASAQPTASMNAQPPATTNATPPAPPSAPSSAATATASARPETPGPTTTANAGTGTSPSAPVSPDASSTRAAPADDGC
jgi:protein phosphatase